MISQCTLTKKKKSSQMLDVFKAVGRRFKEAIFLLKTARTERMSYTLKDRSCVLTTSMIKHANLTSIEVLCSAVMNKS